MALIPLCTELKERKHHTVLTVFLIFQGAETDNMFCFCIHETLTRTAKDFVILESIHTASQASVQIVKSIRFNQQPRVKTPLISQ